MIVILSVAKNPRIYLAGATVYTFRVFSELL